MRCHRRSQGGVGYAQDGCCRERLKRRGGLGLHDRVEVGNITGEMQCRDLPRTLRVLIETTNITSHHKIGELGSLPEVDEILVGRDLLCVPAQIENSLLLFVSEY